MRRDYQGAPSGTGSRPSDHDPSGHGRPGFDPLREAAPPALPGQHVIIDYTNWRGERSVRRIVPNMESLWYGFNDWHKEAQWLLDAYDVEKGDIRTFAMKDIHSWRPAETPEEEAARNEFEQYDGQELDAAYGPTGGLR